MKLSICMMVKDEEKNLRRCLDKLKPLVESGLAELIIVDTGSTDNTELIAREYTDKVYFSKWNKNFSAMRNISISYAKGEWIFIIDADERLDNVEKLMKLMNSSEIKNYNTIMVQVKSLYNVTDESKYNLISSPRLFKNDGKFRYVGAVHNQPIFKEPNLETDINLTHFGYIIQDKQLMDTKYQRTTELIKLELEKNPKNLYYIYQLGISYDMHGEHKKSLNEFRKAYAILKSKSLEDKKIYVYIYGSYARIAFTNNEFGETSNVAKEALTYEKDYVDLYYLLGISEKQLGNNEDSIRYFKKYIDLVKRYNELEISNNMSIIMYQIDDNCKSMAYLEIVKYYLDSEKYKEAYEIYNNIINVNEKIYAAINILIPLKLYPELRKVYSSFTLAKDKNSFLCTLEEKIKELEDSQKINLYREFSLNEDLYGLFNKVRITSNTDDKIRLAKLFLKEIDFGKAPIFYSGIFENVKESIELIIAVFKGKEVRNLKGIVKYLSEEKGFKEIFENYILKDNKTIKDIEEAKVFISIANVLLLLYIKDNDKVSDKYLNIFKAYLNIGMGFAQELYRLDRAKLIYKNINDQEDRFFIIMYIINNLVKENDKKSALKYMIEAVNTYEPIAKYIYVYKDEIINLEEEKIVQEKNKEFENYKLKVKENINDLANSGLIEEAKGLIGEYEGIVKDDVEIYSIKAVIAIMENKFEESEFVLKEGLSIDKNNFDLNYNLAYLYEQEDKYNDALNYYKIALENCKDENVKSDIINIVEKISSEHNNLIVEDKKKITFFVKQGMDSFIGDIINGLSDEYETRKIIVTDYKQIDEGMDWADICWFEWCDELVAYGSKLKIACKKKIICRLHSYEAFTNYPNNVNWDDVDNVIFVAEHIRNFVVEKFKINKNRTTIIPNGIDIQRYSFKERKTGFNIAYVGYINYKKGPMLLLHTFKAIYDKDSRYKLYIAGQFQDDRDLLYFKQMIKEFGIEKNVFYEGWQDNLDEWLENKNYILCTSVLESQNMSVMHAMAKGIKPIVHNFVGAKGVYDKKYVWNTIDEAVEMINSQEYFSKEYKEYIVENYEKDQHINKIRQILVEEAVIKKNNPLENQPLVTVGIPNYNYSAYLDICLESIFKQNYNNVEIIIVDDCSTDNSKEKIEGYANKYSNIKAIYHKINSGGCFIASNEVIKTAKGDYIIILSADDCLAHEYVLTDMVKEFERDDKLEYVYGNFKIIDQDGNPIGKWEYKQFNDNEIVRETFKRGGSGIMPLTAGMYNMRYFRNKNLVWKIYGRNVVGWDTQNTLINIKNNLKYKYVNEEFISYRQHKNNMTFNIKERVFSLIANMEYLVKNFNENIYLPEIDWNKFDTQSQKAIKYYNIGCKYYELFMTHYENNWIPFENKQVNVNKREVLDYLIPFVDVMDKYFTKCINANICHRERILEINQKIKELYK